MNVIRSGGDVVILSFSGDTCIMVLALASIDDLVKVCFDCGNGKCRKRMCLGAVGMKDEEKKAFVEFHSFTGNDYIPSIFLKGKKQCWSTMKSNESFLKSIYRTRHRLGYDGTASECHRTVLVCFIQVKKEVS